MSNQEAEADRPVSDSWSTTQSQVVEVKHAWTIENFSFYQHDKVIMSPPFSAPNHGETKWRLEVHPNGVSEESRGYISLHLSLFSRAKNGVPAKFKISILNDEREEIEVMECGEPRRFRTGRSRGFERFIRRDVVLRNERNCLARDKFTVFCRISALADIVHLFGWGPSEQIPDPQSIAGCSSTGQERAANYAPNFSPPASPASMRNYIASLRAKIAALETDLQKLIEQMNINVRSSFNPSLLGNPATGRVGVSAGTSSRVLSSKELQDNEFAFRSKTDALITMYNNLATALSVANMMRTSTTSTPGNSREDSSETFEDTSRPPSSNPSRSSAYSQPTYGVQPEPIVLPEIAEDRREDHRRPETSSARAPTVGHHLPERSMSVPEYSQGLASALMVLANQGRSRSLDLTLASDFHRTNWEGVRAALLATSNGNAPGTSAEATGAANQTHPLNLHRDRFPLPAVAEERKASDLIDMDSLRIFDGDMNSFREWWICFKSKVHDRKDLSVPEKFSCLRSLLEGEATEAIIDTGHAYGDYYGTLKNLLASAERLGLL